MICVWGRGGWWALCEVTKSQSVLHMVIYGDSQGLRAVLPRVSGTVRGQVVVRPPCFHSNPVWLFPGSVSGLCCPRGNSPQQLPPLQSVYLVLRLSVSLLSANCVPGSEVSTYISLSSPGLQSQWPLYELMGLSPRGGTDLEC